ncbi:unnamed protein product [Cunninghamella echinulata]
MDKRNIELSHCIQHTFEPIIQTQQFPRSQIDIYIQLFQHDGSMLQTCINTTTLALIDAGIPMADFICACSAGCIDNKTAILDLNNIEENSDTPELTLAILPRSGKVNLIELESRLHIEHLESVTELAKEGCLQIHETLSDVVRDNMEHLLNRMNA